MGKFVSESNFEHYSPSGYPSNEKTISLKVARKWRQLKQKTGKGIFQKFRVVLYKNLKNPPHDLLFKILSVGDAKICTSDFENLHKKDWDFVVVESTDLYLSDDLTLRALKKKGFSFVRGDFLIDFVSRPNHQKPKFNKYLIHL